MGAVDELVRAREAYDRRDWVTAYGELSTVDPIHMDPGAFATLATVAYLLGRKNDCVQAFQRAYRAHLDAGDHLGAVRCAFWLARTLLMSGEAAVGSGWVARAQRLLDEEPSDVVERGYVQMLWMYRHIFAGELETALALAVEIEDRGRRFCDPDLVAMGLTAQGRVLLSTGRVPEGLASSTKRWPAWLPARSRSASPATSTARSSRAARTSRISDVQPNGQRRSAPGATPSPASSPTRVSAQSIADRSCVCTVPTTRRSPSSSGPSKRYLRAGPRWPPVSRSASVATSCASGAGSTTQRTPTSGPAASAMIRNPVWPCCGWRRAGSTKRSPPHVGWQPSRATRSTARKCLPASSRSSSPRPPSRKPKH